MKCHLQRLIAVSAVSFFSLAAKASLFEIQCKGSETDRVPEFILLTEDHVNYTFAAFTVATQDKDLEPRMVVTLQNDDGINKFFASKKADGVLQTVHYRAHHLSMKGELFADLHRGLDNRLDLKSGAQLLSADNQVLADFVCVRLN